MYVIFGTEQKFNDLYDLPGEAVLKVDPTQHPTSHKRYQGDDHNTRDDVFSTCCLLAFLPVVWLRNCVLKLS